MSTSTDSPTQGSSLSALVATLAPAAVYAAVYVAIFLVLRRSHRRFYAPRTYLGSIPERNRTPSLPDGIFNWFGAFNKIPDTHALQHQSFDAYLFLRLIKISATICLVGCFITWPVLFPVNATGHGGASGLDILAYGNVATSPDSNKNRYYAHTFVAWIYYGFILYMVARESIYYINLRQAFLLAPLYSNRISSRTVLFTAVPERYLSESKLRQVFGKSVKTIWITCDTDKLDDLVDQRDKAFAKLEAGEIKLIKLANKNRLKAIKKGEHQEEDNANAATATGESGSIAARWVPAKKRPTHKLGFLGLLGKKVDTIEWAREELQRLIPEVAEEQAKYKAGEYKPVGGVFIEFYEQAEAQAALQSLAHHHALHMSPRYIGVNPNEIVWPSLKINWWQRVVRNYLVKGFIAALIVFWAIPVAVVGIISNVTYLETISFLTWIADIPSVILGVVTGLLPSVALSILMSLVPIIMRLCAKQAGEPSLARVELFTQNAYFCFNIIQTFLVVTIGSSATAVGKQIADDPSSTTSLLAKNLPKASNFYISYFILQGLALASGVLAQVVGFFIFQLLYKFLATTPRKMYNKWTNLSAISWGSLLPVFTMIVAIAITYSCIAPLVLGFATIGLYIFYIAYRYNILFVTDAKIDTKGLIYPRALQQILTGVYLSEVCLIGLFGISTAIGPLVLMVIFLVFTVLIHYAMNTALDPLLYNLPKTLEAEEQAYRAAEAENGEGSTPIKNGASNDIKNGDKDSSNKTSLDTEAAPRKKPNFLVKFLKPHVYTDYATLRRLIAHGYVDVDNLYSQEIEKNAYYPPSVTSEAGIIWIPRDPAGVSRQEVEHTSKVISITDEGAQLDEKNKIVWDADGARPPIWQEPILY